MLRAEYIKSWNFLKGKRNYKINKLNSLIIPKPSFNNIKLKGKTKMSGIWMMDAMTMQNKYYLKGAFRAENCR